MVVEVWIVIMPNADRPFTRTMPPTKELMEKWSSEGARFFRLSGEVPDRSPFDGTYTKDSDVFFTWPGEVTESSVSTFARKRSTDSPDWSKIET